MIFVPVGDLLSALCGIHMLLAVLLRVEAYVHFMRLRLALALFLVRSWLHS